MNSTTSQPISRARPRVSVIAVGVAAVSIGLLAVVALGGAGGPSGNGGAVVPPPSASPVGPAATPAPSPEPTTAPRPSPTDRPTPIPTSTPSDGGGDAMPIRVDLENATDADVHVDIVDQTGLLVDAASGTPGDGASVEGYTIAVANLDPRTLKLTWVDFPTDNALALYVDRYDGRLRLLLVQPEPTEVTDAIGFDRVLILTFSEPVPASDVEAILQDGLDTPG